MALPSQPLVALGARLARFPQVTTLGVRANLEDYPPDHLTLIRRAQCVYYPTRLFAEQLFSQGKRIFPSLETHLYAGDKIKQTNLLKLLDLSHPRTRVYYGRQCETIEQDFSYPFVAKAPRRSAQGRGVFLIKGPGELEKYLAGNQPAYIQEFLSLTADVRVVVIGFEPVCAYWRRQAPGEFRSNLAQGGRVDFADVPKQAVELAVEAARLANLDEVGVDVAISKGLPYLLEFNMKYGRRGPRMAGVDVTRVVMEKILAGQL